MFLKPNKWARTRSEISTDVLLKDWQCKEKKSNIIIIIIIIMSLFLLSSS